LFCEQTHAWYLAEIIGIGSLVVYCITEARHRLNNILVIYAILYFLFCSNIWDIIKQNLLDKEKALILDPFSTELISVYDHAKYNH